jgi:6-phosphogluconolactonase (cycloisomerase 2 family)
MRYQPVSGTLAGFVLALSLAACGGGDGAAPVTVAYVANSISDNVTTFSIDAATGALTEVGTEVAAGDAPVSVAVDPSGRFAYVANVNSDNVTTFSINQTTGALTEVGTEVPAGDGPESIVILGVLQ